jgi:hypothetical protein
LYKKFYKKNSGVRIQYEFYKRLFEKYFAVTLNTFRSPLTPLKKGGTGVKVPLFKGSHCGLGVSPSRASGMDLGGSIMFCYQEEDF